MFRIESALRRAVALSAVTSALVACGSQVDIASTQGSGGGGGAASSSASSSATSTSSSTSSTSSGSLPPWTCAPGEAAIVAAFGSGQSVIAVAHEGTWTADALALPASTLVATYVDVYHQLGALWIDPSTSKSHFATTADGKSFDLHDVNGWMPIANDPLAAVTNSVLLGVDAEGTRLAWFDPDAFDWDPYLGPTPIHATSAAPLGATGEILVVGLGPQNELCDVATSAGVWGDVHCREDIQVATAIGGEITIALPRAVALPNGDVVVVYHDDTSDLGTTLAATTLHAGAWSTPERRSPAMVSIDLGAAATPAGDVLVGSSVGDPKLLRYAPGAGWSAPISLDGMGGYSVQVATGICGDDALIAYSSGEPHDEVRVARVRGDVAETFAILDFEGDYARPLSISTRRPASVF